MKTSLATLPAAMLPPAAVFHAVAIRAAIIVVALAVPLAAQWDFPTAGIPRTADGKLNLSAPAPRTADGHPDFSGVWDVEHLRPCPPAGCVDFNAPPVEFGNVGAGMKGGLPYQPWAQTIAKERSAAQRKDDPLTHCLPIGIVELQTIPMYRKIIQVPGLIAIVHEYNAGYRQIFTDGRPFPADMQPSWNGYSTGKWEGDTLVVETTGFRDGIWLDTGGDPITDRAKVTEHFRRVNFGRLEVEITVDDPKAYTRPWTIKMGQILMPDTDLLDYICLENEKDVTHLVVK
jgi:hypothetical protein